MESDDRQGQITQVKRRSFRSEAVKLALALALFALAGGLVFARRAEWAKLICTTPLLAQQGAHTPSPPKFDLTNVNIPKKEIRGGGPQKDGIPALTNPPTITPAKADYLAANDRVAGVTLEGVSRAYPLRILTWHEIVNDTVGGIPIAMTYCPLCDSVVVFDRRTSEGVKEFGVSGLLYNSNVLMYDRGGNPEALWSQIRGESISGLKPGSSLDTLPVEVTTWASWSARRPETDVLSIDTGHKRQYDVDPYAEYFERPELMFPVAHTDQRLPAKERVLGVWLADGTARAYPASAFVDKTKAVVIHDELGGKPLEVRYDPASKGLAVASASDEVRWMYSLWFAWSAFHPETTLYEPR